LQVPFWCSSEPSVLSGPYLPLASQSGSF
jgi:hypothetical protein